MAEFTIADKDLAALKGAVVVLTGCASGIGLASAQLFLSLGALVVAGDLQQAPVEHDNFTFVTTNVGSWDELTQLFETAKQKHGKIDHVFANAGIGGKANYLEGKLDDKGKLLEPEHITIDINLRAVINTATLAIHYMKQQPTGGSIVLTSSSASFQRFRIVDYTAAKHGVTGFMRALSAALVAARLPIRLNAITPSWTISGLVPPGAVEKVGKKSQGPEIPARSAAILMADTTRDGQLIFSMEGRFKELEGVFKKVAHDITEYDLEDDIVMERLLGLMKAAAEAKAAEAKAAETKAQTNGVTAH